MTLSPSLNKESAEALREFANSMPVTIDNIYESTQRLFRVYQTVSEQVGPHDQDFLAMLTLIKSAQEIAADALQILPGMLIRTADKIDEYIANNPSIG